MSDVTTRAALEGLSKGWSAGNPPQRLSDIVSADALYTDPATNRHTLLRTDLCLVMRENLGQWGRLQGVPETLAVFISLSDRKCYVIAGGELYDCSEYVDESEVKMALDAFSAGRAISR